MDAVETVSLQISHSTSSHNDLYVLRLRRKKKKMWRERKKNQCHFLLYIRNDSKMTVPASHRQVASSFLWPLGGEINNIML